MTTLETRANSKADSSETTTGPVVTLDQVKEALADVAAHPQCSEKMANTIAINSGGVINASRDAGRLPREAWETIKPKKFERVLRKCISVIDNADAEGMVAEEKRAAVAEVDVVGKQITALADKIKRECEAEYKHKAESGSFFQTLTEKLKEAEPLAKAAGMTMKALKLKYVGDRLGGTRFKLALRIARGRITHEQATEADTKLAREKRAKAKPKEVGGGIPQTKPSETEPVVETAGGRRNGVYVKSHDPERTANMTRITKGLHKAEAAGDLDMVAKFKAEREAAEMIMTETKTVGAETFTLVSLNYENDFADSAVNGCLTREEIAENERYQRVLNPPAAAALVPALDLMPETLEQCLDRMMAKAREAKSVVPAHTVCVECIEYLAPLMNEGTRNQLRKDISTITNAADKYARRKAA